MSSSIQSNPSPQPITESTLILANMKIIDEMEKIRAKMNLLQNAWESTRGENYTSKEDPMVLQERIGELTGKMRKWLQLLTCSLDLLKQISPSKSKPEDLGALPTSPTPEKPRLLSPPPLQNPSPPLQTEPNDSVKRLRRSVKSNKGDEVVSLQ